MVSDSADYSVGFEPAERLAQDRETLRRRFWVKFKKVVARLPFAEELLAAYYCAFDKETPRHVQVSLLGAIAYFVLPFDFVPDVLPILGFTDDAAVLATAIRMVTSNITPDHHAAARAMLARLASDRSAKDSADDDHRD
ncbi:YkvA family protein [Bradyrhizobium sp. HKCCYLR20261]|uniref:YkvA family protein n=1 Tax=unclassified Bradyrhizobium TaxID=2631580 RepID=UPI003EB69622